MNHFSATLRWPIISLLLTGGSHFTLEAIRPDLGTIFVPAVLSPLLLAYGIWVGYRTIEAHGGYVHAILAGAILGALPLILDVVGFGFLLGRGIDAGTSAGLFGFAIVVFGSLVGSGFALSGRTTRAG